MQQNKYVRVIIEHKSQAVDRLYDYKVPETLLEYVKPGMRVYVPFGKGNKPHQAFVVETKNETDIEEDKLKEILYLHDETPIVPGYLINLLVFIRNTYFCTYSESAHTILSAVDLKQVYEKYVDVDRSVPVEEYLARIGNRARKQQFALQKLYEEKAPLKKTVFMNRYSVSSAVMKALCEKNILILSDRPKIDGSSGSTVRIQQQPLTPDQESVMRIFCNNISQRSKKYLLYGVTGSGKTRVFFEMFDRMLKSGKQCLLLVPEISLTPQMMRSVSRRFGEKVAIMHSRLGYAERRCEYQKIKNGQAKIVLGARSAIFMPMDNLGLIVIDEEHETSYKASSSPRYDTIEIANKISDDTGCTLVLASATPSIESYYRAQQGEYEILSLPKRVNDTPLPIVTIRDMRMELREGNRSPISRLLYDKIKQRLENREQVVLFLNRRGYSTYVFCRQCGYIEKCPNCDVSLTYHMGSSKMHCHYCGYEKNVSRVCPECKSDKIRYMGTGTEKIERFVKKCFPQARIMRLDSDTAKTKDAYRKTFSLFREGKADILIGTQMVVKGLDFDRVTLVGILLADSSLNFPDINASARTFQLTEQAAGRAGRREKQGEVILQTYMPQHPTLIYSSLHDYENFYIYDITHRKEMNYPPFTEILGVFVADEDENLCIQDAIKLHKAIEKLITEHALDVKLYQPAPAFIQKLKNKYIHHILMQYKKDSAFKSVLRGAFNEMKLSVTSNVYVEINPITLL